MKKKIYAVKSGRKTGIFNEWQKCREQVDKHPNGEFLSFEYRSDLEGEPEDVPESLRYAIKEAKEFLEDLVYLGESGDCLEDVSWVEEGFLPFGNKPEAESSEVFSDKRGGMAYADEEDIEEFEDVEDFEDAEDFEEELDEWSIDNRSALDEQMESWEIEYWKIAEDMKKCIELIKCGRSNAEKRTAASDLKRHLERCLDDMELNDLTLIYRGLKENNVIGYDPPAVAKFVGRMLNRYPKP